MNNFAQPRLLGALFAVLFALANIDGGGLQAAAQTVVHQQAFPAGLIPSNQNISASGDGYAPIPFQDRVYYMNHHVAIGPTQLFGCIEIEANSTSCSNFGAATSNLNNVYTQPMSDGDGPVSGVELFSSTSSANEEYSIMGDRFFYFPVTRFTGNTGNVPLDWGMGCYDLMTDAECGYFSLSTNPNNRRYSVAIEGPFVVGTRHFLLDMEMQLYCVDVNPATGAMINCTTPNSDLYTQSGLPRFTSDNDTTSGHIGGEVVGDKIYLTVAYHGVNTQTPTGSLATATGKAAVCVDTSGGGITVCPLWGGARNFASREREDNFSNYIAYNTAMVPQHICNRNTSTQSCLSLTDGSDTSNMQADVVSGAPLFLGLGKEVTVDTRTFFPSWAQNSVFCFDWSTQSSCAGFTPSIIPLQAASLYGFEKDVANCIWAFGHNNRLWSLDPISLATPCRRGGFEEIAQKQCPAATWHDFVVTQVTTADYASLEVDIKDTSGSWITYDLLASASINLQGNAFLGAGSIEYRIRAVYATGVSALSTNPVITIRADEVPCVNGGGGVINDAAAVKVCKVAGEGVDIGTPFTFTGDGRSVTVPAGPAPLGYCGILGTDFQPGDDIQITETGPNGYAVTDITVLPVSRHGGTDFAGKWVEILTGTGVTEVTFTNEKRLGYLEICKQGVSTGTYNFAIRHPASGQSLPRVSVPAGACSPAIEVPSGTLEIYEQQVNGIVMQSCDTFPASAQITCDPSNNLSVVNVVPGNIEDQTIAIITNCNGDVGRDGRCYGESTLRDGTFNPNGSMEMSPIGVSMETDESSDARAPFSSELDGKLNYDPKKYKPGEKAPHDNEADRLNAESLLR